ncbi:MAG: hypothetical protein QME32_08290, partial [Endomicrobiia bacterium]|nr:hypothetical protein [Endomicrobiia bacterium]
IVCSNYEVDDKKIKELCRNGDLSGIEMLDFIVLDKNSGLKSYVSKKAQGVIREEKNIYGHGAEDADEKKTGVYAIHPERVSGGRRRPAMENLRDSSVNGESKSTKEAGAMIKVTDSAAKGSYVAKITGIDEKYGVKREFLYTGLDWTKKKGIAGLSIRPEDIASGDIIALKIVKSPEDKDAKEHFYRIVSEPADNAALHNIVKKIPGGIEEVKKMLAQNGEAASMSGDEAGAQNDDIFGDPNTPIFNDSDDGNADTEDPFMGDDLIVTKGSLRKSYVALITGAEADGRFKRDFVSFYKEGALRVSASNIKQGDVVAMKIIRAGQKPGEAKECYYKIIKDPAEENQMHKVVQKITREDVVSLLAGKSAGVSEDGETEAAAAETSDDFIADGGDMSAEGFDDYGQNSNAGKARGRRM